MSEEDEERRVGERRRDSAPYEGPERRKHVRLEPDGSAALSAAMARLATFRTTWEAGDRIDDFSGLTADDLDLILEQLNVEPVERAAGNPVMREIR